MFAPRTPARVLCLAVLAVAVGVAAAPRVHAAPQASFTIVASQTAANAGQNFNGADKGRIAITVAPGTAVDVKFMNNKTAALPHSFQVIALKGTAASPVLPAQAQPKPVFAGAETPKPAQGTPPGKTADVRFTASKAGHYLFICGFPGHALLGMYGVFNVTPGAKPGMRIAK